MEAQGSTASQKSGLELNSPWFFLAKSLSILGRLVLENMLKSGQAWLTRTYIYFLLATAYPTMNALGIPGSADRCPWSLPTEPRSSHRVATADLMTPGCIRGKSWVTLRRPPSWRPAVTCPGGARACPVPLVPTLTLGHSLLERAPLSFSIPRKEGKETNLVK